MKNSKTPILEEAEIVKKIQLKNQFNNISEFAKLNDISCFDDNNESEHIIRGLLMNLEFMAIHWELIDHNKYEHRKLQINKIDNILPQEAHV